MRVGYFSEEKEEEEPDYYEEEEDEEGDCVDRGVFGVPEVGPVSAVGRGEEVILQDYGYEEPGD